MTRRREPDDTFDVDGRTFGVWAERDDWQRAPWEDDDTYHGLVTDWLGRDKRPNERTLVRDRGSARFIDWAGLVARARAEGWHGEGGATPGQRAEQAAFAAFERLRAWCRDEWYYAWIEVLPLDDDGKPLPVPPEAMNTLGGVESDYIDEAARDCASAVIAAEEDIGWHDPRALELGQPIAA